MTTPTFVRLLLAIATSTLLPLRGGAANPAFIPQTQPADVISATQAMLHGTIGLNGKAGYVAFQIRRADKRYVGHTPWQKISRGQTNVTFSAAATRLSPDTDYDFRAVALVRGVKRIGLQLSFPSASLPPPSAPPTVTFASASGITASNAVLSVSVNPNGAATLVTFEWGPSTSYGNTTPAQSIGSGTSAVSVQATVSGLVPGTIYYWRIVATNSAGVTYVNGPPFTPPAPAIAETLPPGEVRGDSAVLVGRYNTFGQLGSISVAWGLTTNYDHNVYLGQNNSPTWEQTALPLDGLMPRTTYHYRFSAGNSLGGSAGEDVAFTTSGSAPIAMTTNPVVNSATNAILNAVVNSGDLHTAFWFEWGATSNYTARTAIQILSPSANDATVQGDLFLLRAVTTYHYRAVASNQLGVSYGSDVSFVTLSGAPAATTEFASDITSGSAILHASVNPSGLPTLVLFEWGLTASYGNSVAAAQLSGGAETIAVSSTITSLLSQAAYHFRVIASNSVGVTVGNDLAFVTLCQPSTNAIVITNCTEADLRAALASASSIRFECDGTITLTSPIAVVCSLTLDARGHAVTLSGGNSNRLFNVGSGANLQLINLFLADGQVQGTNSTDPGGGLSPYAPAGSGESVEGGGILLTNATLYAEGCVFTNCTAIGGHGFTAVSIRSSGSGGNAVGSVISAHNSAVLLTNCVLSGNRSFAGLSGENGQHVRQASYAYGAGGALYAQASVVSIANCTFSDNYATSRGGVIEAVLSDTKVAHSIFAGNSVGVAAPSSVRRFDAQGGAVAMSDGQMIVTSSAFNRNSSVGGGGALAILAGIAKINGCDFSTNVARGDNGAITLAAGFPQSAGNGSGGGVTVLGGQLTIENSAFEGNQALGGDGLFSIGFGDALAGSGLGGALYNQALLAVTNCTFGFNIAASGGPPLLAVNRGGNGGAIASDGGTVTIASSTMAGNSVSDPNTNASFGGAVYRSLGGLAVLNSIFAFNSVNTNANSNLAGDIADLGHSISSDASANFTAAGSLNNTAPLLGPLGDYGGFTFTFPLLPGSPAIDAADSASSPATDQRGVPRPQGPAPDIGAFERQ